MSCALAGLTTGEGAAGTGAFFAHGVAFFGGVGRAEARESPAGVAGGAATGARAGAGAEPASSAARSRRATGASTVRDADLTNSPISLSLASTVLLSTPSSFASSCTRALPATALLTPRPRGQVPAATSLLHLKPEHCGDFIVCSCRSSYLAVGRDSRPAGCPGRCEHRGERAGVDDTGDAQCAPEGATALRKREAGRIGVHMCSPSRPDARRVGLGDEHSVTPLNRDDSQQLGGLGSLPATHPGAYPGRAADHPDSLPRTRWVSRAVVPL